MPGGVVRQGDPNVAGGIVTSGHSNILVNNIPPAAKGTVTPHPPCPRSPGHCSATAAFPGSSKVLAIGQPVITISDSDSCGHTRGNGSSNVICLS